MKKGDYQYGLFPLRIFLFTGEQTTLHIFEPRYLQLVNECLSAKGGPDFPFKSADIENKLRNLVVGNPSYLLEPLVNILNLKDDYLNANWKDIIQK